MMIAIEGVLVPVDFSKQSVLAAKFGASLAQEYKTGLYVLHVREPLPLAAQMEIADYETFQQKAEDEVRAELAKVIPQSIKDLIHVKEILEVGSPVHHVIVEKAKELRVDVIVIPTHGRTGLAHVMLGSVAEHVIRHAPCPVFVIRNPKDKYVYGWE
jgi:universal stress protein A